MKVTDLGSAALLDKKTGRVLDWPVAQGTTHYIPPEMARVHENWSRLGAKALQEVTVSNLFRIVSVQLSLIILQNAIVLCNHMAV